MAHGFLHTRPVDLSSLSFDATFIIFRIFIAKIGNNGTYFPSQFPSRKPPPKSDTRKITSGGVVEGVECVIKMLRSA